jgi:hypothetical protein
VTQITLTEVRPGAWRYVVLRDGEPVAADEFYYTAAEALADALECPTAV